MQYDTDRLFGDYSGEDMIVDEQSFRVDQEGVDINATQMAQVREIIANQMWNNYHRWLITITLYFVGGWCIFLYLFYLYVLAAWQIEI